MIFGEIPVDTVICLYSEDIEDEYIYGFPIIYDEEELVLACIDCYGENDGYLLLHNEGIYRVDFQSACEKKIEQLYRLKKQNHKEITFSKDEISFMEDLLAWAFREKKIVTIGFADDDYEVSGYIENLAEYRIAKIDISECRSEQGITCIDPRMASYIRIDSRRARDAARVYEYEEELQDERKDQKSISE